MTFRMASKAALPVAAETFPWTTVSGSRFFRSRTSIVPYSNMASETFDTGRTSSFTFAILTPCLITPASPTTRGLQSS